jgi:hypothetical protein
MNTLVRYDAMCVAIAEAFAVDEVKDIRDKAIAMEAYARQARNTEAERKACEIRLRAERRCGQLLSELEKAKGAIEPGTNRGLTPSHAATASKPLADLGISRTQSSRWQKLAAIPDADFEATWAQPDAKPSTSGLIAAHQAKSEPAFAPVIEMEPDPPSIPEPPRKPVDPRALWLWGRLLDFEREGLLSADPNELVGTMIEHMREATFELAPVVAAWLRRIAT